MTDTSSIITPKQPGCPQSHFMFSSSSDTTPGPPTQLSWTPDEKDEIKEKHQRITHTRTNTNPRQCCQSTMKVFNGDMTGRCGGCGWLPVVYCAEGIYRLRLKAPVSCQHERVSYLPGSGTPFQSVSELSAVTLHHPVGAILAAGGSAR